MGDGGDGIKYSRKDREESVEKLILSLLAYSRGKDRFIWEDMKDIILGPSLLGKRI